MNLTQMRTEVAAKLSLDTTNAAELALIDQWLNDGVAHVVGETESKVAIATASLSAGQGDYELDTNILRILWIQAGSSGGQNAEFEQVGPSEILRRRLNAASSSSPSYLYAVDGSNMLMVYPVPASADTLTFRYVPRPATLTVGSDTPTEIPAEFHKLVVLYALVHGGDYDDDQTSAQGERYEQNLERGITRMRSRLNKKRGRRMARAVVSRRRRVPHRNDTYPN